MPYHSIDELPKGVRDNLPEKAQEIFLQAYNHAFEEYKNPSSRKGNVSREEVSHKVAWAAVKKSYQKNKNGIWVKKK